MINSNKRYLSFIKFISGCEAKLSSREAARIVDSWQPMVQALQVVILMMIMMNDDDGDDDDGDDYDDDDDDDDGGWQRV